MSAARQAVLGAAQNYQKISQADILFTRAAQLYAAGKFADAKVEYRKVLKKRPNHFTSWHMLGLCEYLGGHYEAAVRLLKRALLLDPRSASAQSDLGVALTAMQRHDEAVACFDKAIALKPGSFDACYNRASVLNQLRRFSEALAGFDMAIQINPQHADAWKNRSTALRMLCRFPDALASCDQAIEISPDDAGNWSNRAEILRMMGRHQDALTSCDKALSINPELDIAWLFRARVMRDVGQVSEALAACQRALAINPDLPEAMSELGSCLASEADAEAAVSYFDRSLAIKPDDEFTLSSRIFALDFTAAGDFASHQAARSLWWDRIGAKIAAERSLRYDHPFDPGKRIVLGYVSGDFRQHSAAFIVRSILRNHDRSRFEIICYSSGNVEDTMTASFRQLADRWRDVQPWSDEQMVESIRNDGVDILIDLAGHTQGNRLRVFASKPAPIQVTAWGHSTGTGQPTIDYLFADPVLIPAEVRPLFAEEIYDLPCAIAIEPPPAALRSPEPPVASNGYLTYGVFNRITKISDSAVALWAKILRSDPTARLTIKDQGTEVASIRAKLLNNFASHGIGRDRLRLIGATSREDHLAAYGEVDICLDPFPHGGGVSTWEALHMGVPVVAKLGNALPKRLSGAILAAIGMTDWVATNDEGYVDIALRPSPERLKILRRELPDMIEANCGAATYTRAVEIAYQTMWRKRCEANSVS
jgi:predicted O-linked N-acetylglucosamine transferase (SPINDLY family)